MWAGSRESRNLDPKGAAKNKAQLREATEQMFSYCKASESAYKAGNAEYEMISARDVLYTLGFQPASADEILAAIGEAGFNYCLDPTVTHDDGSIPSRDVCVWGIDQLRARLQCIDI